MSRGQFQKEIYSYYKRYGRNLSWRRTRDPYKILVSEVMLQQTQVKRVVPKYREFIKTFPNFQTLLRSSLRKILKAWNGLGYNRRALYLRRIAQIIVRDYGGKLPRDIDRLQELPGIGRATASSILAFAYNQPVVFVETNIRSVFIHFFFKKRKRVRDSEILKLVEKTLDNKNPREWYWALMDYGSMLKKEFPNPSQKSAHHMRQSPFKGSDRQIRGAIVRLLVRSSLSEHSILEKVDANSKRVKHIFNQLQQEGFVTRNSKRKVTFAVI